MKKIAIYPLFLLIFLIPFTLLGKAEVFSPNVFVPSISWDKTTHNFGKIQVGIQQNCTFVFENTGSDPITIIAVSTSDPSISVVYTKNTVNPGQIGNVEVLVTPTTQGPINAQIWVHTDSGASIPLLIVGMVKKTFHSQH